MSPLVDALSRMLVIWWGLTLAAGIASRGSGSRALALAQLGAVAAAGLRPRSGAAAAVARGLMAGWIGYEGWRWAVLGLGVAIGLSPPEARSDGVDLWTGLQRCLLAPVWEESLYRGRLLPALVRPLGPVAAVGVSSLAFALPHLQPWPLLGSFVVGCGLGVVYLRSRSAWTCIGIHAGFNGAARLWGGDPAGPTAALASGLAFWWVARGGRRRESR